MGHMMKSCATILAGFTAAGLTACGAGAPDAPMAGKVTAPEPAALRTLQQIKTVFVIPLENHDWVQANPEAHPRF